MKNKVLIGIGIFALISLGVFFLFLGEEDLPGQVDGFANCLTENGVIMYGTEWCSHCKNQKELFGSSFQYVNYIDCDKNKNECIAAGVKGYPTWKINGENYPGEQSFERLSNLSGCDIYG